MLLAAAVFAHGMAELGDDRLAMLGEHEVDGDRRASAELEPRLRLGSDVEDVTGPVTSSNESGRGLGGVG